MFPISVCIIARNEEKYIGECLSRLSKYDWEIVVVDTGSTDQTCDIALTYTPQVFHFDWCGDFSMARNYSISKAHNDYILVVDCDEYLEDFPVTEEVIYNLTHLISPNQIGMIDITNIYSSDISGDNSFEIIHEHIARFFHRQYTRYQGSIHEQLVSKEGKKLSFVHLPICFHHIGYSTHNIREKKAERNISMLKQFLKNETANPYLYFQLGQSYFGISNYETALFYFERALSIAISEQEDYAQTLVESYGYCLLYLKQYKTALQLEGIYDIFSRRADFVFLMGLVYMNNAMFEQAIDAFLHATSISNYAVEGVNSYKAFYNIGVIYECMGNTSKALEYYGKCSDYLPSLQRLETLTL
ncbi:glycosyltransferase [Kineothrix sp. MB12-C1]|uniref:glycosyltransferase n=1 Tax=Kineothrix sp. MB12-C1 TaxID=3070215 RepID=UPI0027D2CEF1|nr:TPR domain-containing glycosyltransferase [Kineothrix sp. MB12-C1]WMC93877.1 glycosyltransferase [Kineothrix sp. MB12-C1]